MPKRKTKAKKTSWFTELWNRPPYRFTVFVLLVAFVGSYFLYNSFASSNILLNETFTGNDALIANEYGYRNPTTCPKTSPRWSLSSGSLFRQSDQGYSGKIDHREVDCYSKTGTNSAVFRMTSNRNNFGNVSFDMSFKEVSSQQANSYDGLHVWVRKQSEFALYAISVGRLDHELVIKKKVPGGPSNGGTYYDLGKTVYNPTVTAFNTHHHCTISVWDDANKVVHIRLVQDNVPIMEVTDNGVGGPAYHTGAVGVRGDNIEFYMDNIVVRQI